jgi:ABC-type glycerol-3-phosphate transport system substrate-binding protein
MKKLCITALLFIAALGFVFGAGQKADTSGKTVVRLGIWPEDTRPNEIAMHQGFVKEFNKLYPNIVMQPANYRYAVDTFVPMAEAGQTPTVFYAWFTEPQKLINGGFVKDITDEVKALGWESKMNASIRQTLTKNGRLYGIPQDAYCMGLMINLELFKQAGLMNADGTPKYPKTWEELAITAQTIKQKTGSAGFVLLAKDNAGGWHFSIIAWNFGAEFEVQRNGKWYAQINTPEVLAALQYVSDLKWKYDAITDEPTNENWDTGYRAIGTGAAAMYLGEAGSVNQPTKNYGLPLTELALAPVPGGPKGQYSLMGGTHFMFGANATSEQVSAALKYIEIMGKAPVVNEQTRAGIEAGKITNEKDGVPVVRTFPA